MLLRATIAVVFISGCAQSNLKEGGHSVAAEPKIVVAEGDRTYWTPVFKEAPEYPLSAVQRGIEGCAYISYIIDSDGKVSKADLIKSSNSIFNKASLSAVEKFTFSATEMNKKSHPVRTHTVMMFEVQGEKNSRAIREKCVID